MDIEEEIIPDFAGTNQSGSSIMMDSIAMMDATQSQNPKTITYDQNDFSYQNNTTSNNLQSNKFKNSQLVSDNSFIQSSEILEASGLQGSSGLQGRVVGKSKLKNTPGNIKPQNGLIESSIMDYSGANKNDSSVAQDKEINPAQLRREKLEFMDRKYSKLMKDRKYGFTLSELDNKIRKKQYGQLVKKCKEHQKECEKIETQSELDMHHETDNCNFCKTHSLEQHRIPMSKIMKLIPDYYACKFRDEVIDNDPDNDPEQLKQDEERQKALRGLVTQIETRDFVNKKVMELKYRNLYGKPPPEGIF